MKFLCPYCRRECDFEEMQMDTDLHAIIRMLPSFGPHANLVAAYTELFGISPLKTRRKKWRLLLEEMKRLFDGESFVYNRRSYSIARAGIAEALNLIVHRHWESHLENHNYLKKIMIGIAERADKDAGRQAEKDLRKKEAGLMSGRARSNGDMGGNGDTMPHRVPISAAMKTIPAAHLTDEQIEENRRKVEALLKKIG
jgi:hypothetical protein